MAKKKPTNKSDSTPPFEDALESLNEVVQQLEDGQLSLSDSLEQYELGVKHLKHCHAALKLAERKIELLVKLDKDGNLVTQDFDDSATEHVGTGTRRKSSKQKVTQSPKAIKPSNAGRSVEEQQLVDELDDETDDSGATDDPSSLF